MSHPAVVVVVVVVVVMIAPHTQTPPHTPQNFLERGWPRGNVVT